MRFYFHLVSASTAHIDNRGVECENLSKAIDQARAAIAELKAEGSEDFPADGYLVITSSGQKIVIVLPLDEH